MRSRRLPRSLVVMVGALCLVACHERGGPVATPPSKSVAREPQGRPRKVPAEAEGGATRVTLDNGLYAIIVQSSLAPVVSTVMSYRVGSNESPRGFPGTAHAVEHMMFRGSPGLSAAQLAMIGAALGGDLNAATQETLTQYFYTVPAADLDTVLNIEVHRMRGILATPRDWARERGAIEQEVARDLSNPEYVLYTMLRGALFEGTPYAHDALGTRPSFDATTASMLRRFHQRWYAPNNAVLVIAGKVDPSQAAARVREIFGGLQRRPLPKRPRVALAAVQPRTFRLSSDRPAGLALVAFRFPGFHDADYAASRVLANVLDSERGPIQELAAEGKALDAGFTLEAGPAASIGSAWAEVAPAQDPAEAADLLERALKRVTEGGVASDLVSAARGQVRVAAELRKNSVLGLAMQWSDAIALEGLSSPEDDVRAAQRVADRDVDAVARGYLDVAHAIVGLLSPARAQAAVPLAPSSSSRGPERALLPEGPVHAVELPPWARGVLRRLEVPPSMLHPTVTWLENGLELIVQPETVSRTVSVYGHIQSEPGLETPRGQEGVDRVLDRLLDYGTERLDRLAFRKALDDIGANEGSGVDFYLEVPTQGFERGVALLAENETHPRLPGAGFEIVRRQVADAVRGLVASPGYRADRALRAALYPKGDPLLRDPTVETVESLTLDDVVSYHRRVFRPDLTTVVVIGDVTVERAQKVVEAELGPWKAVGPKPEILLPPVPPSSAARVRVSDPSRVQDEVTLAETLELVRSSRDYYAVVLGNGALGGGFYATRLYRDLRERRGLVYHVDSRLDVRRTRGLYAVHYGCDPDKTAQVRTRIEAELRELQQRPVGPDELRQVKALLLRRIPLDEASVSAIAHGFLERVTLDLPLDEPTRAARHYLDLGATDVRKAFARWIRPDRLVEVVQGPAAR